MNAKIIKRIKNRDAYFTVAWSSLTKAEKYEIKGSVPAEAGIFELYYMDESKRLSLMYISRVWFGGLRSTIRELTDPVLEFDPKWKDILTKYDCYFRYTLSSSSSDMKDVMFYFSEVLYPGSELCSDSGRYESIYLLENSPENFDTV